MAGVQPGPRTQVHVAQLLVTVAELHLHVNRLLPLDDRHRLEGK